MYILIKKKLCKNFCTTIYFSIKKKTRGTILIKGLKVFIYNLFLNKKKMLHCYKSIDLIVKIEQKYRFYS